MREMLFQENIMSNKTRVMETLKKFSVRLEKLSLNMPLVTGKCSWELQQRWKNRMRNLALKRILLNRVLKFVRTTCLQRMAHIGLIWKCVPQTRKIAATIAKL